MPSYTDLELSLHRLEANAFQVDFRFSQPNSDADIRMTPGQAARAKFDQPQFLEGVQVEVDACGGDKSAVADFGQGARAAEPLPGAL